MVCSAATVELTKRAGENAGLIRDVLGVSELPVAILLPPVYALCMPMFRFALIQLRVRKTPLHKRIFSIAIVGLGNGAASLVFHALTGTGADADGSPFPHPTAWLAAVAIAAAATWVTNTTLLLAAVKGSDPTVRIRDLVLARENLHNDIAQFCVAVLVTLGVAVSAFTIVFALPFVTLLQRSVRHAQLLAASRIDSKTGLLNAGTWEREAASEVARAVRTRTPLALVLIDVDHFKLVNDLHGHLVGNKRFGRLRALSEYTLVDGDLAGGSAARSSRYFCRRPVRPMPGILPSACACTSRRCRSASAMNRGLRRLQGYCVDRGGGARNHLGADNRQPAHRPARGRRPGPVPGQERGPQPRLDVHGHRKCRSAAQPRAAGSLIRVAPPDNLQAHS